MCRLSGEAISFLPFVLILLYFIRRIYEYGDKVKLLPNMLPPKKVAAAEKVDTGRQKKCGIKSGIYMEKCIFAVLNLLEKCRSDAVQKDPIIYR